jgi:TRAP-type mannitol/chloroaromatic compound transport system substrate-binding protein
MKRLNRREFVLKAGIGATGTGVLAGCGAPDTQSPNGDGVVSGPRVTWRMATSFPTSLDILHGAALLVSDRVAALTGGRFTIRVYPPGELVPPLQVMDAVQSGTAHAGYTSDYYYIGKHPALAFGTSIPFGLNARQQTAWLHYGGGLELLRGIYADFGMTSIPCGNTGVQFGGWFRRPIDSLADLQGIRMRIPGPAGEIMARLGVTVHVLGGPDIYPALERGVIDATEWVGPYDDEKLGFHEIAKNYYVPGWWEPGPSTVLQIGLEAWNDLPPSYQAALQSACNDATIMTLGRYDIENPPALERLTSEHGVTLRRFSDEIMEAAWVETEAYLEEQASANQDFRRIYDSWRAFRAQSFAYFSSNESVYTDFAFSRT